MHVLLPLPLDRLEDADCARQLSKLPRSSSLALLLLLLLLIYPTL